ncbi:MAG TPA: zinc-dependent metalloprotease [Bacteroidia bacterium]|nr:zinc-dependent metalloprotease [Bacteroidia bacterium]
MKNIFTFILLIVTAILAKTNAQSTMKCGSLEAMHKMEASQPGYIQSTRDLFTQFHQTENNRAISDTFLYVRVVVHVVYNTPEENLADSVIFNQINILNNDYGRMNADTVNMRPVFSPIAGVDSRIRFLLANTDPQGNPTTGITRTSTTSTSFFDILAGGLAEGVKSTANGGIDPWDQSRYLNIWVCDMSIPFIGPAILGYAVPPSGLPNWDPGSTDGISDGVVIQYQVFGSNNPNILSLGGTTYAVKGRTPVHEVGHYLGLRHIWGDANNCTGEDGIADTPKANDASAQDCDASKNTCTDNIAGIDMPDMIENYMDYSAEDCQNSFTMEQLQFMRWVIRSHRTDIATVSFTNMEEHKLGSAIIIVPNPASESVKIMNMPKSKLNFIKVYDIAGNLISSNQVSNQQETVQLETSNFNNGIYLLEIEGENFAKRLKLSVLH